jgi:carnitine 3-dehydrogenase
MPSAAFSGNAVDERPQLTALLTLEAIIDDVWIAYNGQMTEWQYYKRLADAGENFLRALGFTEDYRLKSFSFFSVQGAMRNLKRMPRRRSASDLYGHDRVRRSPVAYLPVCHRHGAQDHRRNGRAFDGSR